MARARNIKPGLWLNEELADVSITARYFFPALWCHADKDGRLEFRPKKLKAEVFPYDNVDITALAGELHGKKFISVYESEGKLYIQIANFAKHQNPHPKEKSEGYPEPVNICNYDSHENKFLFGAGRVILPFPSSSLIPSSLIPAADDTPAPVIPFQEVVNAFNRFCPSLKKVHTVNSPRHAAIRRAWLAYEHHEGGAARMLDALFKKAEASDFLSGRNGKWKGCTFDWLLDNYAKVIDGNYENGEPAGHSGKSSTGLTREEEIADLKEKGLL